MKEIIDKAVIRVVTGYPFFASILLRMERIVTEKIPTAATDGVSLLINPTFFQKLSADERVFLLCHEVLHPAFLHHTRRGDRDSKIWNYAADYVINPILKEAGLPMPKGCLYNRAYAGKSVDEVYKLLIEESNGKGTSGQTGSGEGWVPGDGFGGGVGDVMDFPSLTNENLTSQEEIEQVQALRQASIAAKAVGKGIGSIETVIDAFLKPEVDWVTELRRLLSEKTRDDYTWNKPNRRYLGSGFYLPALESDTYGEVVVGVDTSGSISQKELDRYASEINELHDVANNQVTVIYCDSKVRRVESFEADDTVALKVFGGGGTCFKPPFKWVDDQDLDLKLFLYFTDGYCSTFPRDPGYYVLWLVTENTRFKPPFGEVIHIE